MDGVCPSLCLQPGHSDCSFGIEVAQLAGIPRTVIRRAQVSSVNEYIINYYVSDVLKRYQCSSSVRAF